MRVFTTLREAALEIRRDLAKSPEVVSKRVQHMAQDAIAHEAMNYAYTILQMPTSRDEFIRLGVELGFYDAKHVVDITRWLVEEEQFRISWSPGAVTERKHPALQQVLEGNEPSYAYTDRLRGAVDTLADLLSDTPDTRRGFWPIFNVEDAVRSSRMTRIPCSLGYQLMIRDVNRVPHLHLTYVQRSCDFQHFWYSDIWFAYRFQRAVFSRIDSPKTLKLGSVSHVILSLHTFINDEVY